MTDLALESTAEHYVVYDVDLNRVSCNCGFRPDAADPDAEALVAAHLSTPLTPAGYFGGLLALTTIKTGATP